MFHKRWHSIFWYKIITESHAADIETLKRSIESEREEREMGLSSMMGEREIFTKNMTQVKVQIDEIMQRVHANISSELVSCN